MAYPRPEPRLPEPYHPLASRAVVGLDAGRRTARRTQRWRRWRDRAVSLAVAGLVLAVVGAAAWYGYEFYQEQQDEDLLENEQNRVVTGGDGTGNDLRNAIDELERSPHWNGPGNPAFGVGDAPVATTP